MYKIYSVLENARACLSSGKYKKAISYYNLFQYVYNDISYLININKKYIKKNFLNCLEQFYVVMEIHFHGDKCRTIEYFEKIVANSSIDVEIEISTLSDVEYCLLAWYDVNDFMDRKDNNDRILAKKFLQEFLTKTSFFDPDYYIEYNKFSLEKKNALNHFVQYGYEEGKAPARWFSLYLTKKKKDFKEDTTKIQHRKYISLIENSSKPKISVIIPFYNCEKYISECIFSVQEQTIKDIEIICINDGSLDNSQKIIETIARSDSRLISLQQENLGAGAARNRGLFKASGKYLLFLDSDDFFEKNYFEKMLTIMEDSGADFSVAAMDFYNTDEKIFKTAAHTIRKDLRDYNNSTLNFRMIKENIFKSMMGWAFDKMYRREFIAKNNILFQEIRIHNDMYFVYTALLFAKRFAVVDSLFVHKRIGIKDQISNSKEKFWRCFYDALMKLKQCAVDIGVYNEIERSYLNYVVHIVVVYRMALQNTNQFNKFVDFISNKLEPRLNILSYPQVYFYSKKEFDIYNTLIGLRIS